MEQSLKPGKEKKRRSGATKAVDLLLRCAHVGTASVLFGGLQLGVPFARLGSWHTLAGATGGALILAGICQSRHWPYQGRGVLAIIHVLLLGLVHSYHDLIAPLLVVVLVVGMIGSNLPGHLRHWSLLHGERVD
jgi:hypothetical protein